jgi:ATP-binding cassette subfamily C (CFTR/MRP) protein 1
MASKSVSCAVKNLNYFGPATLCPGVFDFTLLFEETILTILPAVIVVALVPLYYFQTLSRCDRKVSKTWHVKAKLVSEARSIDSHRPY